MKSHSVVRNVIEFCDRMVTWLCEFLSGSFWTEIVSYFSLDLKRKFRIVEIRELVRFKGTPLCFRIGKGCCKDE